MSLKAPTTCFIQPVIKGSYSFTHSALSRRNRPFCLSHSTRQYCRSANNVVTACIFDANHPQNMEPIDGTYSHSIPYENSNASESATDTTLSPAYDTGGSGGTGGGDAGGGSGGGGGGEDGYDDSLPEDMKAALAYGSLTRDALQRYRDSMQHPMLRLLLAIPAFRSRFLMDAQFLFKLLVQEIVGNGTSLAGEIVVRGRDIVHELEYVASDLIVGTVIEAAFVWLLAPTLSLPLSSSASPISRYLSSLPAHAFQPSTALQSFTMSQRVASFFYSAWQYAAIGFAGGVVGTAITYGLLEARKLVDKDYKPFRPMPPVIPNSAGWAAFMGFSCNTRFQLVEGLELGVAKLFAKSNESLVNSAIVALRFVNNYYGGVQFVQFFRAIGLHATGDEGEGEVRELDESNSKAGAQPSTSSTAQ